MAARLDDVRAAIHKTAAGRMSQTTAPEKAPSSVSLDLDVLATQAQDYSSGAAAGAKQAQGNAAANEQLLNEDRASADSDRAQAIDLTRQNAVDLELQRQASAEKAQQNIAEIQQRAALDAQEAQARAANAAAERQVAQQREAEGRRLEAEKAAEDGELFRIEEERSRVARQHDGKHVGLYDYIGKYASNFDEAQETIAQIARNGGFGKGGEFNSVRMDIIYQDLKRLYGG